MYNISSINDSLNQHLDSDYPYGIMVSSNSSYTLDTIQGHREKGPGGSMS